MTQPLNATSLPPVLGAEIYPILVPPEDPLTLRVGELKLVKEALAGRGPCISLLSETPLCDLAKRIDEEFGVFKIKYQASALTAVSKDSQYVKGVKNATFQNNTSLAIKMTIWPQYYEQIIGSLHRRQWIGDVIASENDRLERIKRELGERISVVSEEIQAPESSNGLADNRLIGERDQLNQIVCHLFPQQSSEEV